MLIRALPLLASTLLLTACAATYTAPVSRSPEISFASTAPIPTVMAAARRALVADGYQITSADDVSGTISTAPRDLRLTPDLADCGTTMGLDYLKDNRTNTRMSLGVIADGKTVSVRGTPQANYGQADITQSITLTCVSKGVIEQQMADRIKAAL